MTGVYDGRREERCRSRPRPLSHVLIGCIHSSADRRALSPRIFKRSTSRGDIIDSEWRFSKEYPPPEEPSEEECFVPLPSDKTVKNAKSASFASAGFNAMKQRSKSLMNMLSSNSKNIHPTQDKQTEVEVSENCTLNGYVKKAPPSRDLKDLRIRRNEPNSSDFWEWNRPNSPAKSFQNISKLPSSSRRASKSSQLKSFHNSNNERNVSMEIPFIDESPKSRRRSETISNTVEVSVSDLNGPPVPHYERPLSTSTLKNELQFKERVLKNKKCDDDDRVKRTNFSANVISDITKKVCEQRDYHESISSSNKRFQPMQHRPSHLLSYSQRIESIESTTSHYALPNSPNPCVVTSVSERLSTCTVSPQTKMVTQRSARIRLYSKPDPPLSSEKLIPQQKSQRPNSYCDYDKNRLLNSAGQVTYPPYSENCCRKLELINNHWNSAICLRVPYENYSPIKQTSSNSGIYANGNVIKDFSHHKLGPSTNFVNVRQNSCLSECRLKDNLNTDSSAIPDKSLSNTNNIRERYIPSSSSHETHYAAIQRSAPVETKVDPFLTRRGTRPLSYPNQTGKLFNLDPTSPAVRKMLLPSNSFSYEEPELEQECSIYRRGARRWRKHYKINGHIFQAKRFNRRASCAFCKDRIWGLGRQGFKCTQCKLLVHKKCSKLQHIPCNNDLDTSCDTLTSHESSTISRPGSNGGIYITNDYALKEGIVSGMTEETIVETPVSLDANSGSNSNTVATANSNSAGQFSMDDFELIRVIGRGSYAKVLMVELKKNNRIYAMKVIKKTLVADDEDIDWVQTEKHVFETASNHPFLVGLHSCFQTPSRLFFVIEFVRGGDLMFHMQRQRRLPEEHARFYAAEICLALNFLHEKGIIYRDLKLDNVLLDHEGHIKLTDYGMCKEGIRPRDTTSTFCGTPNYIAPEILQGEEYSFSVDWWALGVLLYEMLAGKSPFDIVGASENPDTNTEDFLFQVILERPIRIPRSLSVKAASILKGFLNKNPVDRLGCHLETGFNDIVTHIFFKSMDWEMLEQRQVTPPYRPRLEGDRDLANFPPEFTDEPIQLTPDDPREIENLDQTEFEGFEYVNPLLMSMEDCV